MLLLPKRPSSYSKINLQALSPLSILLIGLLVTGIALLESWKGWAYAPFPIAHVLLTLFIPAWFNCFHLENPWRALRSHHQLLLGLAASALLFIGGYILIYSLFLNFFGR